MSEHVVTIDAHEGSTAVITINRPGALNALNMDVLAGLAQAIRRVRDDGVRHVILTGSGDKAFVAGADIGAMQTLNRSEAKFFARRGQRVLMALQRFPGVTIAAVNGFALGGGMELAMACDLILCSENARFGQPEVNLGVIPGFGGTQRLVRLVGAQRARELVFTGRMVKAPEAVALGIALRAVPAGTVLDEALALAQTIAEKGPQAIRLAKQACSIAEQFELELGLQEEADFFGQCFETADQREGMAAFLEKRPAQFTGC